MKHTSASLEVVKDGTSFSINVIMPVWHKEVNDAVKVEMPLLGLSNYASNENEIQTAVDETVLCFCIAAQKYGKGIDAELNKMGWSNYANSTLEFDAYEENDVMESIMNTGDQYVNSLELEEAFA